MAKRHIKFVYDDDGNKIGIMLTKHDFETIIEKLEDFDDYKIIKKRARKKVSFEQVVAGIARHK